MKSTQIQNNLTNTLEHTDSIWTIFSKSKNTKQQSETYESVVEMNGHVRVMLKKKKKTHNSNMIKW